MIFWKQVIRSKPHGELIQSAAVKRASMGDIGTHAFNMAEYVSGLQVTKICADINIVVEGRKLDDDGAAFLKFNNGATGVLFATQIAAGEENNIKIKYMERKVECNGSRKIVIH